MEENIEQRVDLTLFSEKIQELKDQIASVIVGQEQTVDLVLAAILANGHHRSGRLNHVAIGGGKRFQAAACACSENRLNCKTIF